MFRLVMLGGCELRGPDNETIAVPTRKAMAVLAYLAAQPDRCAGRETLVGLLWESADEKQGRTSLRQVLASIRRAAGDALLCAEGDNLRLETSLVSTDVSAFEEAVRQSEGAALDQANKLYRGDFLTGLTLRDAPTFNDWVAVERQRLRELALQAMSRRLDIAVEKRSTEAAIQAAVRLLAIDPLQEHAHRALMRLYVRQGRHGAALKHYHALVRTLECELGVQPEPATQALFRELSANRRTVAATSAAALADSDFPSADISPPASQGQKAAAHAKAKPRPYSRLWLAGAAGLVLAGAAGAFLTLGEASGPTGRPAAEHVTAAPAKSVAVLPFASFSTHADTGYFADGLTEEVIDSLAQVADLKVAGRTSAFYFKGRDADLREIGARLGVAYVVEGSVRQTDDRLRVTAQLISVRDGFHLWSQTYDRTMNDAFAIQDEIAQAVAQELKARLVAAPKPELATLDPDAYRLYLVARAHMQERSSKQNKIARSLLERVLAIEPDNVRALASYANVTMQLAQQNMALDFETARAQSAAAIDKALRLNPQSGEAHLAQGVFFAILARWTQKETREYQALAAFRRASELEPRRSDVLALYGMQLNRMNRREKAIPILRQAIDMDPLERFAQVTLASALKNDGNFDAALRHFKQVAELFPDYSEPRLFAAETLMDQGKLDEAEPWLRQALAIEHDDYTAIMLAQLYINLGMREAADRQLASMQAADAATLVRILRGHIAGNYRDSLAIAKAETGNDPESPWRSAIFLNSTLLGDYRRARQELNDLYPGMLKSDPAIEIVAPDVILCAVDVLNHTGEREQARRIMAKALTATAPKPGRDQLPWNYRTRIGIYAGLGDTERALKEFRRAIDSGFRVLFDIENMVRLDAYPAIGKLRGDLRFEAMMREIESDNARMRARLLARQNVAEAATGKIR